MSKIHRIAFHQVSIRGYTSYGAVAQGGYIACTGRSQNARGSYIVCSSTGRFSAKLNARGAWHPRPGI